jgi:transcription initiation factor IIE alpha subunit
MPHYICVPCKTRLDTGAARDQAGELCPSCGAMLQPVADLRDAVGFAAIARQTARAQESEGSRAHTALTDRLSEAVARRRASSAVGDDEPGLHTLAVALPQSPPSP